MRNGLSLEDKLLRLWTEVQAQDLVEYSLMAGFVAMSASAIVPGVSTYISRVMSNVSSVMVNSSRQT